MTPSKLFTNVLLLCIGGIIGYFIGFNSNKKTINITSPVKIDKPIEKLPTEEISTLEIKTETVEDTSNNIINSNPKISSDKKDTTTIITEPEIETPISPSTNNQLPNDQLCFADNKQLSLQLTLFAERLEKDSLWYNSREPEKLLDCSGIFHQTAKFVSSKCEAYQYPDPKVARDSRSLAKWYNEKNNLIIIDDAKSKRNLIRPGVVMFFGKSGKFYQPNVTQVTAPYPNGIVEHIGVVTEIKIDEEGDVIGYTLFHGRRPGVTAQRSYYHNIKPPRLGYPSLGNWNQQWVAISNIMSPK